MHGWLMLIYEHASHWQRLLWALALHSFVLGIRQISFSLGYSSAGKRIMFGDAPGSPNLSNMAT